MSDITSNQVRDNTFWRSGAYTGAPALTAEDNAVVAALREMEESRCNYTGSQLTEIERLLRRVYRAGATAKAQRRRRKVTRIGPLNGANGLTTNGSAHGE